MMDRKKVYELDKICRVCTSERKEMRPLFSEKVAEMLMDCTSVRVEPLEGWPDKICVQCVHSVSRNYAFKMLVERSDKELREYIDNLTMQALKNDGNNKNQLLRHQSQIQLHQKQKKLQKQIKEQQQQIEEQQQKLQEQQELLQQQQQQLAQPIVVMPQQQQQQQQQESQTPPKMKLKPLAKKPLHPITTASKQKQQHELLPATTEHMNTLATSVTAAPHPTALTATPTTVTTTLQAAPPQLLPTTTAMPQQILLPNGQIITTTQLVAPQLTQIVSTVPQTTAANTQTAASTLTAAQPQFMPQLLQTPGGHAIQIVQQPNGTQTLQLVQLMPQQNITTAGTSTMLNTADNDVQLINESDVEDELYDNIDNKGGGCIETIVLEDELKEHQQQHEIIDEEDLTIRSDTQEMEFFEDMDSSQHIEDEMPDQLLQEEDAEEEEEDGSFIIEEIQMDEEMLDEDELDEEDVVNNGVVHVMDSISVVEMTGNEEYIHDDGQHTSDGHLLQTVNADEVDELDYTILEAGEEEDTEVLEHHTIIEDDEVQEVLKMPNIRQQNTSAELTSDEATVVGPSPAKKSRRNNNTGSLKVSAANSRQLAATASVIAAVGSDDNYEIDAKLVTEFIRQQTTPLGSGRYICNLCNTEFRQFKGLQNHMHSHTNWIRANCKKQPQCQICLKSFKGPGMLRMHMKTHDADSISPKCNICNKTFKSKAILYRHRQTHQLRVYSCGASSCRKSFSTTTNLRSHIERKHPESMLGVYKCGECCSLFEDGDALQAHVEYTGHGTPNANSGEIVDDGDVDELAVIDADTVCDITDVGAATLTATGTNSGNVGNSATETTVVMGSSGEVFFVTQA